MQVTIGDNGDLTIIRLERYATDKLLAVLADVQYSVHEDEETNKRFAKKLHDEITKARYNYGNLGAK